MNPMQTDVLEFIRRTQTPEIAETPGSWPHQKAKDLCYKLIKEEVVDELLPAIENDDWEGIIDGICDAIYVLFFCANKIKIDIQPFYDLVQEANMKKFDGPIDPETGKQLKPPGWRPPDIEGLLGRVRAATRPPVEL